MGRGALLDAPVKAVPGTRKGQGASSREPWENWHLWLDRLWEAVCCMAQLGTLDRGRKLRRPKVGRDEEPLGPGSYSSHRQQS